MRSPDIQQNPIPFKISDGRRMFRRQDLQCLEYRVTRYLSYISDEELRERLIDVFSNLTTLTPEGKIGLAWNHGSTTFPWGELWIHVMEEYRLRGMGIPNRFIWDASVPNPPPEGPAKGTRELGERGLNADGHLVKYGNASWLREAYESGKWRVAPASYYSSESLCRARKDSELVFNYSVPHFEKHPNATNIIDENSPDTLTKVEPFQAKATTDYYLSCLSRTFIHRLFDDFASDSCLIVTDERAFTEKVTIAFQRLYPNWMSSYGRVKYVDPMLPRSHPDIFLAKHFKYSYQDEFRFVWVPAIRTAKLEPVFLNLGSLRKCCEFMPLLSSRAA